MPSSICINQQLTAALKYAERGFLVFPMYEPTADFTGCSCHKREKCSHPGKHPRTDKGFNSASHNPQEITAWWSQYPNANLGIATGKRSDLIVIDVDERHGGPATMDALVDAVGETLPLTLTALTGNGVHYYFRAPELPLRSVAGALGSGVDVRAERGCVVAPPSLHSNGKRYEFVDPEAEVAELPSWIRDRLQSECDPQADIVGGSSIPKGMRNNCLASIAGELRQNGADFAGIRAELITINQLRCAPPLAEYEVDAIAKSIAAYRDGTTTPRRKSASVSPLYWFKLNIHWWNGNVNVALMDAEQIGWYMSLLVKAFAAGGKLPAETAVLAKLARAKSTKAFERKSELVLKEFERYTGEDGTHYLSHPMLRLNYAEARESVQQASEAGKESGLQRKRQRDGVAV